MVDLHNYINRELNSADWTVLRHIRKFKFPKFQRNFEKIKNHEIKFREI